MWEVAGLAVLILCGLAFYPGFVELWDIVYNLAVDAGLPSGFTASLLALTPYLVLAGMFLWPIINLLRGGWEKRKPPEE